MLFNSIDFAVFLPLVFVLYWCAQRSLRLQNLLMIAASYVFYGWWDWRFLSLIVFSSVVDYAVGLALFRCKRTSARRTLLATSILVNIGLLGFFKYYNFFIESFAGTYGLFGQPIELRSLQIILPVGISFYTFQTLSYSIDIYRRKIEPTKDVFAFCAFVSFFPQLVAGPIERASHLLPQFLRRRSFEYDRAIDGLRQILWGLFKKVVIADSCARYVDQIFAGSADYSGSTLLLGAVLFAFQIYGDFSGYSDIAIGVSRLFGFSLMRNFAFPYFSRDIAEFWRRWHISLSTWFRDYVYLPLGGSKGGRWRTVRNTFIVFLVSGFWHGANWTFVVWGLINAVLFLPLLLRGANRKHLDTAAAGKVLPSSRELAQILTTFALTTVAWVFFRAESVSHAVEYLAGIFNVSLFRAPEVFPVPVLLGIAFLLGVEWLQRERQHALEFDRFHIPQPVRWSIYYALVLVILTLGPRQQSFIYFQF